MKPIPLLRLGAIALVAVLAGHTIGTLFGSHGQPIPGLGFVPGIVLAIIGAVIFRAGLLVKRYMDESRALAQSAARFPRRHHIDMTQAFRIIQAARAGAYSGAIVLGFFVGLGVYLATSGGGTFLGATLPIVVNVFAALFLTVVSVIVERWGMLPPSDGEAEESGAEPSHQGAA